MIQYSPRAAKALGFLKRSFNELEIFVEDTRGQNMWLAMIRSILGESIRIRSVNQLGGRSRVLAACRLDQADDGRRRLYIVDGDCDHVIGRSKPRLRNLYRLRAYCIENLLVDRTIIGKIARFSKPELPEAESLRIFDFEVWINEVDRAFRELFYVYSAAQVLGLNAQTIGFPVVKLCTNASSGVSPCSDKVLRRKKDLFRLMLAGRSKALVRSTMASIEARGRILPIGRVISGKDYILPLMHLRLCRLLNYHGKMEQLKVQLASFWSPSLEPHFARRLRMLTL